MNDVTVEMLGMTATALAVAGVLLNNRRIIACFGLWMISNVICLVLHSSAGMVSLAIRDAIFFVLAIEGFMRWGQEKNDR